MSIENCNDEGNGIGKKKKLHKEKTTWGSEEVDWAKGVCIRRNLGISGRSNPMLEPADPPGRRNTTIGAKKLKGRRREKKMRQDVVRWAKTRRWHLSKKTQTTYEKRVPIAGGKPAAPS